MTDELKPCPLCGDGIDGVSYITYTERVAEITCHNCGVTLDGEHGESRGEHIARWNRRHVPEPTEAERFAMAKGLRDFLASAPLDEQVRYPGSVLEYYECAIRAAIAALRGTT